MGGFLRTGSHGGGWTCLAEGGDGAEKCREVQAAGMDEVHGPLVDISTEVGPSPGESWSQIRVMLIGWALRQVLRY